MIEDPKLRPVAGLGVMVLKGNFVLLGKRKKAPGVGEYGFTGGHLEGMETFEDCAKRETLEEAGVEIENVRFNRVLNMRRYAPKHYLHISMIADWKSGEPQTLEPEKCEGWDWYPLDALPEPLFATVREDIEAMRSGKVCWED